MTNRYKSMMNQVRLSDDIKADIKVKLSEKAQRTVPSRGIVMKGVVAAACLCAVLLFAATAIFPLGADEHTVIDSEDTAFTVNAPLSSVFAVFEQAIVDIENQISTIDRSSFAISAELESKPLDSLGEDLRADIQSDKVEKAFYTKEDLENYLGFSLISAPEIEAAGIIENLEKGFEYGINIRPELTIDPNARYVVTESMLDGSATDGEPEVIKVTSHRVMWNAEVYIDARIITEYADTDSGKILLAGESYDPVLLPHHKLIINPEDPSDFHVITTTYTSAEKEFETTSYAMDNGCTATIITISDIEMDGTKGFADFIGYFVRDGVLYTVYPYAIYNPYKDFPSDSYDMLHVLRGVLDSFE